MVRDLDVEVVIIDENTENNYKEKVNTFKDRILFTGISSIIGSQILGGIRFSKYIKELNIKNIVVWGGWHSTILPEQTLKEEYIDFVITGQAEEAFRELAIALLNNKDYQDIKGLYYKKGTEIIKSTGLEFCDYNAYPPVNYALIDINNYIYYPSFAKKSIVYFASHGCPYNCNFCAMATFYHQKWIARDIDIIINDLKYFKEKAGIDSVFFQDDNFFSNKKFSLALAQAFIDEKLDLRWETWTHAGGFLRMFNATEIDLFYKAGCRQIISGSESGSQEVLDLVNKKLSVQENLDFVKLLKSHKITPFFSIMLCFPDNTKKEIEDTFEMIRKAKLIDNTLKIYFSFYTPYPGTKLFSTAIDKGFKMPDSLNGWAKHTFDDFRAPWWHTDHEKKLNLFAHFYIPLSSPDNYKNFPRKPLIKMILFVINKMFYPLVILRFKTNCFKFPIEAVLFLFLLKKFNTVFRTNYKLYPF